MDLRSYLGQLQEHDSLIEIRKPVNPVTQMSAFIHQALRERKKSILFHNIEGHPAWRAVGALVANRDSLATAFGTNKCELSRSLSKRIKNLVPCALVEDGPIFENSFTGPQVDLGIIPTHWFSNVDAGRYIGSALLICKDPDTGVRNVAIHRHQVKGPNRLGIGMAPRHTWMNYRKYEQRDRPMPVALAIGHHPACLLAASWTAGYEVDEIEIAGALLGEPVLMVKGATVDVEFPASAEVVIEGVILPHVREEEGPFGEHTGCSTGGAGLNPVIEVTAIHHRNNPIYYAMSEGDRTDGSTLDSIPMEAMLYDRLKDVQGYVDLKNVLVPECGGGGHIVVIQMVPRFDGEVKAVLMAALSAQYDHTKIAIAVDDDVDPFNMEDVFWSISTKVNPEHDVFVVPGVKGVALDISLDNASGVPGVVPKGIKIGGKMGIDATKPPLSRREDREAFYRFIPKGFGEVHLD